MQFLILFLLSCSVGYFAFRNIHSVPGAILVCIIFSIIISFLLQLMAGLDFSQSESSVGILKNPFGIFIILLGLSLLGGIFGNMAKKEN